jgi:hypothetical protein
MVTSKSRPIELRRDVYEFNHWNIVVSAWMAGTSPAMTRRFA